jgi:hypothetical protein
MALATLDNVRVEVAGMASERLALGIDEEGLVIGRYGKLSWAGSHLTVETGSDNGCTIHIITPTGADSRFFVPAESLGPSVSPHAFANWLERGAAHSGATILQGTPA